MLLRIFLQYQTAGRSAKVKTINTGNKLLYYMQYFNITLNNSISELTFLNFDLSERALVPIFDTLYNSRPIKVDFGMFRTRKRYDASLADRFLYLASSNRASTFIINQRYHCVYPTCNVN